MYQLLQGILELERLSVTHLNTRKHTCMKWAGNQPFIVREIARERECREEMVNDANRISDYLCQDHHQQQDAPPTTALTPVIHMLLFLNSSLENVIKIRCAKA